MVKPAQPTRVLINENAGRVKKTKTVPAPKVRPSLAVGTVAILLAGPYKGKRVVVVKHLESGT